MFINKYLRMASAVLLSIATSAYAETPVNNEAVFNPAFSLILTGTYGQFQRDPTIPATGFAMNPNPGHVQGFSIGETELGISANIDPDFRGVATMSIDATGGIAVENGFVQSTSLGDGLNLKFGRFFSGLGYLNDQHSHAWDFDDQPLVYATLWNNQLAADGVQLKWLAPTDSFLEIGGELGRGLDYPGTNTPKNGSNAGAVFVHLGDDIGVEHSWRLGASLHQTTQTDALSTAVPDLLNTSGGVTDSFSGNSQTAGVDFVWKYAPNGNIRERHFKLQSEYFRRNENGLLTYDMTGAKIKDSYSVVQSGWYVQSVYQFMPMWRTGIRYDRLDPGIAQVGALNAGNVISNYAFNPSRTTWMIDYSPSEFSRFRLQLAYDATRQGLPDNQCLVQYIMSLGAHGAHQY